MNHIYSVLWNQALGRFGVTSEIGRSRSRATTRRHAGTGRRSGLRLPALALSVALAWAMPAWSQAVLPQGAKVLSGNAQITTSGNQMLVQQGSAKAIVDWQSFNIGKGQQVQFQQPNAASGALNRVVGADASAIHGSLSANGKVFLVNPNGVLFGQGANVNVGAGAQRARQGAAALGEGAEVFLRETHPGFGMGGRWQEQWLEREGRPSMLRRGRPGGLSTNGFCSRVPCGVGPAQRLRGPFMLRRAQHERLAMAQAGFSERLPGAVIGLFGSDCLGRRGRRRGRARGHA
ncbi:MAG: filamentous hemagglutinin N-terminal domain-containing protein [Comamonas sp.]